MLGRLSGWLRLRWSVVLFWAIDLKADVDPPGDDGATWSPDDGGVAVDTRRRLPREMVIRQAPSVLQPRIEALEFGVDPEAIISVARTSKVTATEIASRLARGAHCVTLLTHGQIATTCWVSSGAEWLGELGGSFVPPPGAAYVWDCGTKPVFRGRHFYSTLLREILRRLSDTGYRYVWIATEWRNWKSARGVSGAGFRPVGVVIALRFAILRWQWILPDPTAAHDLVASLQDGLSAHT